jgi:hypothetical protein
MDVRNNRQDATFDSRFKLFHELMANKIRDILLVSTPYDAWIMEEDCRLSERIIHEYRGLNLSNPPRLTWVSSAEEALAALADHHFDMVITMPRVADMDVQSLGQRIKSIKPDLPVVLLTQEAVPPGAVSQGSEHVNGIDHTFLWTGNTDLLLALIKSAEDRLNAPHDAATAGIRVILFVEDAPQYISSLLPILYKTLVMQAQEVMEEGLNEEHRLLTMRARPKILVAHTFEEAMAVYEQFKPSILGVISDVRFPRRDRLDDTAGIDLLSAVKADRWDIPLLLTSSDPRNAEKAGTIPAGFVDKNSATLHAEVRRFFLDRLGFGDFVFRQPDGQEIARATTLKGLEERLSDIPDKAFFHHCQQNDFSRWLFARTEITLASKLRPATAEDFANDFEKMRRFIIDNIHARRKNRQKGVVVNFDPQEFDLDTEFFKIGKGSLGGKARGLAFAATLLQRNPDLQAQYGKLEITIPQTLVITTEGFESFIELNELKGLAKADLPDEEIARIFSQARFPDWLEQTLRAYLERVSYPLAIRSSSLLEDAQFRAYAGLYRTYMIPNDCEELETRLAHLISAVKLVYASTYFEAPRQFSRRVGNRTEEEKMAVILQELVGEIYGESYYPAVSGVAQSHNYYPFARMKPEEGIATIAMGLGRMVVEGEKTLRFSPKHPQLLPQMSKVEDILDNSQQQFYCLKMDGSCQILDINEDSALEKRDITEAEDELPMKLLASTYVHEEHRIRDTTRIPGYRVLTFAHLLKYDLFPLAPILDRVLALGQEGMGCPVELEFSVNLCQTPGCKPQFAILQLRPMTARAELMTVEIDDDDRRRAFCVSQNALGNSDRADITDILYVDPETFKAEHTPRIAQEIGQLNNQLLSQDRPYLLIGPGRWGSADRWLGIPVTWKEICGVSAIVEVSLPELKAEPSQGSHFFHNITTLGINYITVSDSAGDTIDWPWIQSLPVEHQTDFVRHARSPVPVRLKVDGQTSCGVLIAY